MRSPARCALVKLLFSVSTGLALALFTLGPTLAHAAKAPKGAPAEPDGTTPPEELRLSVEAAQKTGTYTPDNKQLATPKKVTATAADGTKVGAGVELQSVTAGAAADTWVEITVKNLDKVSITKLTVAYTVYVKATSEGTGATSIKVTALRGTENVNVPALGEVVVKSKPVTKTISNTASSTVHLGVQSTSTKTAVSDIFGWYIETSYHGQVLKKVEHPDGVVAQYGDVKGK